MATTRTATAVLFNVYTAAQCCDANDARISLEHIYARASTEEQMLPAVLRRIIALRKKLAKFEPEAFMSSDEVAATKAAETMPVPFVSEAQMKRNERMPCTEETTAICHFCQRPIKPTGLQVHMTTDLELTTAAECENSQGYFEVGPECAKKIPARFLFKSVVAVPVVADKISAWIPQKEQFKRDMPAYLAEVAIGNVGGRLLNITLEEAIVVAEEKVAGWIAAGRPDSFTMPAIQAWIEKYKPVVAVATTEALPTIEVAHFETSDAAGPYSERNVSMAGKVIGRIQGGPRRGYWYDADGFGPATVRPTIIEAADDLVAAYRADFRTYGGYQCHAGNVVVCEAAGQSLDTTAGKYAVMCESHNIVGYAQSLPSARIQMATPALFCECCKRELLNS